MTRAKTHAILHITQNNLAVAMGIGSGGPRRVTRLRERLRALLGDA